MVYKVLVMNKREIVNEKLTIRIKKGSSYKTMIFCTWEELIATKKLLPGDQINGIMWVEHEYSTGGFGGMDYEPDERVEWYPAIVVVRPRPETDEEFEKRMKKKATFDEQNLEKEKLEYLRLKAKFEK